jgi:hypothetical protein
MEIRRKHLGLDEQTLGVYQKVTLATLYLLAAIVASWPPFSVVLADWLSMTQH